LFQYYAIITTFQGYDLKIGEIGKWGTVPIFPGCEKIGTVPHFNSISIYNATRIIMARRRWSKARGRVYYHYQIYSE